MQPDYGRMCPELRRKDMTLMLLREEHRADHANGQTHAYSQYCENYRRFVMQLPALHGRLQCAPSLTMSRWSKCVSIWCRSLALVYAIEAAADDRDVPAPAPELAAQDEMLFMRADAPDGGE